MATLTINLEDEIARHVEESARREHKSVSDWVKERLKPENDRGANGAPESLGWPPGFFERVYGSITDDNFKRWPQGTPDPPPSFE